MLKKSTYLLRLIKICKYKNQNVKGKTNRAQSDGQNMLIAFTETDGMLINDVFPRISTDKISITAKTDNLIKAFGSRYLKWHKEKHLINVVYQKNGILPKFLIAMKSEIIEITSMQSCLSPKYFDTIVKCSI